MTDENDREQNAEDDWKKEFDNLYQSIRWDKKTLKKEMENLNEILKDLKEGK